MLRPRLPRPTGHLPMHRHLCCPTWAQRHFPGAQSRQHPALGGGLRHRLPYWALHKLVLGEQTQLGAENVT